MKTLSKRVFKQMDTGYIWTYPILGLEFNFVRVETERKHKPKKRRV